MKNLSPRPRGLLLLHGICSNGEVFGPSIGPGLAALLSPHFRLFIGRLRCHRSGPGEKGWDFDDHLMIDVPAIWKIACESLDEAPGVLGYSMGGMLALVAQSRGLIAAPRMMTLGSPVLFPGVPFYPPLMKRVLAVARQIHLKRIPIRIAARLLFFYFLYKVGESRNRNLDLFHVLARRAGVDIPIETLEQAYRWVSTGRFCDRTGSHDYLDELGSISVPVLFAAGERDRIAPPEAVRPAYEKVASGNRQFVTIPGATHLDLVGGAGLGETARMARSWFANV